jgi:hypothetical protein
VLKKIGGSRLLIIYEIQVIRSTKCLDHDQVKIVMGEVHEGICGTHQSVPKMKWLLRRAGFYWPTMIADCFRYYKGCEKC